MSPTLETPATNTTVAAIESKALRVMVCPLCHTPEPTVNQAAIDAGGGWTCRRCSQPCDRLRLETIAVYATAWAAEHDRP
jgi:ribosomal protein L37AE/L43A